MVCDLSGRPWLFPLVPGEASLKSGSALGDKGQEVAPGHGSLAEVGVWLDWRGLGESVPVPNQQEGPSSSRITFQPSCLDIT